MLRPALALALVAAALLAACGSDSNAGKADTTTNATASTNDDTGGSSPAEGRAAAGRGVRLVKVGDFQAPLYLTAPPGDKRRLFIVEQAGEIVVVRGGKPLAQPFLDIRSKVTAGGEQGLLSMAFAPGLRAVGPVLRLLHREERHRGDLGVPPRQRATAPTPTAPGSCCAWTTPSPTTTAA